MPNAERVTRSITHHGEGPFWDDRTNRMLFMDLLAGAVVALDECGQTTRHGVPSPVASMIRRRSSGGFVIATERGIYFADEALSSFEQAVEITSDTRVRTNDGGCDRGGGLVIGTMAYDETPGLGKLYRVTPECRVVEMISSVSISNGVQWSADGTLAYYVDSPTRRVDVFGVDPITNTWSSRRPLVQIDSTRGVPDGFAIDEQGGLWIALWGAGAVGHYDSLGRLVEMISVPGVSQVSSCAFGGTDRNVLYITTSRSGLAANQEPDAGSVFAIATETQGALQCEFAG
jgi:sugar lactone lactonase YvrE